MFYSHDLLKMRKGGKTRLPICWRMSTLKNPIGKGAQKIKEKDIIAVNIPALCDDIINGLTAKENIARFSLYLSSQLTYGALKIFNKQCDFLIEDLEKLQNMIDFVETPKETKLKKKKDKRTTSASNFDLPADIDLTGIFPEDQVDRHQLDEAQLPLINNFGTSFFEGEPEFRSIRECQYDSPDQGVPANNVGVLLTDLSTILEDSTPINEIQQMLEGNGPEPDVSKTPKRKSYKPHTETPTKKKKAIPTSQQTAATGDDTFSTPPRQQSIDRIELNSKSSEAARSPVSEARRRSLFQEQPQLGDTAPDERFLMTEQNQPLDARAFTPPTDTVTITPQIINQPLPIMSDSASESAPLSERASAQEIQQELSPNENQVQHNEEEGAVNVPPVQIMVTPPGASEQNLRPLDTAEAQIEDEPISDFDSIHLDPLIEAEASNTPRGRKRNRNFQVFDEVRQIRIPSLENMFAHCKPENFSEVDLTKVRAKVILENPATGFRSRSTAFKKVSDWAIPLQEHYKECMEFLDIDARREANVAANKKIVPQKRDELVTRRKQRSYLKNRSASTSIATDHTPSISTHNVPEFDPAVPGQNSNMEESDRERMPPPDLPIQRRTSEVAGMQASHSHSSVQKEQRLTDDFEQQQLNMDVEMQPPIGQEQPPNLDGDSIEQRQPVDIVQHEPVPMQDNDIQEQQPPMHDQQLSPRKRSDDRQPRESSVSSRIEEQLNLIMSLNEFRDFLEKMFEIVAEYIADEDEQPTIYFSDIFPKDTVSTIEVVKYFIYLSELEKRFFLNMKQELPYGPTKIIKASPLDQLFYINEQL